MGNRHATSVASRRLTRARAALLLPIAGTIAAVIATFSVGISAAGAATAHNPVGSLDAAPFVNGAATVSGWAIDPDTANSIGVIASVDGVNVASVLANQPRPDLLHSFPRYGTKHGYVLRVNVPNGTHKVCVTASNYGPGYSTLLGCKLVTGVNNPVGSLDAAPFVNGAATVSGWAIDPNTVNSIGVVASVDGVTAASVPANQPRPDLLHSFPSYGTTHGYVLRVNVPNGSHKVCVTATNYGPGSSTLLGCRLVTGVNNPVGALTDASRGPGSISVTGWALDPNTTAPSTVRILVDKGAPVVAAADQSTTLTSNYSYYGTRHGFTAALPTPSAGSHTVCVTAVNVGFGIDTPLGCRSVAVTVNPVAQLGTITRTDATHISVSGWALDPDTSAPAMLTVVAGGLLSATITANHSPLSTDSAIPATWSAWGTARYFTGTYPIPSGEQTVCINAVNVGPGTNQQLACQYLPAFGATAPPAPQSLTLSTTTTTLSAHWTLPAGDGGSRLTGYRVALSPGTSATVPLATTSRSWTGLKPGTSYTVTVTALNQFGDGVAAIVRANTATPPPPPPPALPAQTTPAPVSTSHYPRNLTGVASHDTAVMRAMGATDASYNPSGHRYLVLQDLGGQTSGGVLLSATSKFVSYADLVASLDAYVDGYVSRQRANAPMVLAIGTNNDVNVDAANGAAWARYLVNPVRAHALAHGIGVVGADDMEPGFSATAAQSESWLAGYLGATTAGFMFNGSADGCPTGLVQGRCNNGWSTAALHWLAGGAAPSRISVLPQIYNTTMAWQWATVSAAGRLNIVGPLTEWTACSQTGGCYSVSNTYAWRYLFSVLSLHATTRETAMPYGTDLQIN